MSTTSDAAETITARADRVRSAYRDAAAGRTVSTLVVAAIATLLSLVGIGRVSMWIDEGYTLTVATRSLADIWRMVHNIDVVHSLYNAMLHPWLALAGVSELTVRLPSALSVGVAAAGVVVLGRRILGERTALAGGLFFAVLPRVTSAGIEGRSYALTMAVAVWLTVLFVALLRRPSLVRHVAYALLGAFACSLNIFLVLLLGAHGVTALLERRVRFSRVFWSWLGAAAVALAGGVPVLLTAVSQAAQIGPTRYGLLGYARAVLVNQWFLGETPTMYLSGGTVIEAPGLQLWQYAAVLLAAGCWLLVGYGVFAPDRAARPAPAPGWRLLLISWLLVPTVVLVGYAVLATPLYNPRYLSFGAPALALALAAGVVRLRPRFLRLVAVLAVLVLAAPIYVSQRGVYAKSGADWSRVAEFVAARRGPDQAVYFAPRTPPRTAEVGLTGRTAAVLYPDAFAGLRDLTLVQTPAQAADLVGRSRLLADSTDRLDGMSVVFVLERRDYPADAHGADAAVLTEAGFRPGDSWTGPLNRVTEYRR